MEAKHKSKKKIKLNINQFICHAHMSPIIIHKCHIDLPSLLYGQMQKYSLFYCWSFNQLLAQLFSDMFQ